MKYTLLIILLGSLFLSYGQVDKYFQLVSKNNGTKILSNGDTIRTMGFTYDPADNPNVPGPTIEINQGDSVKLDLWNKADGPPHTIHLHGLDVDQQNDGVPHLSFEVFFNETKPYYFKALNAGTYLYHCHVASTIHVQAGMYGLLIVHPTDGSLTTWDGGFAYNVEQSLLMSEIDTLWHNDSIIDHNYDTSMTVSSVMLPKYEPQHFLVNGYADTQITDNGLGLNTSVNAVNYIRLANIGFKGNRVIFPSSFGGEIIDSDGRPLPTVEPTDTVLLMPGERYGIIGTFGSELTDVITIEYFDLNTLELCGTQEVPISVVGVLELQREAPMMAVNLYPNPAEGLLTIQLDGNKGTEIDLKMIDMSGRIIKNYRNLDGNTINSGLLLDVNTLQPGKYIIELTIDKEHFVRSSFVKN